MEDGWIKVFRRFLDWEWYSETNMVRIFLHLLLKANFEDKRWHGIVIKRGQFVTSISSLKSEILLSARTIRTCLERLQKTGEINKQTTNRFTIITICRYDDYQQLQDVQRQTNDKQATNKRQTNDKQATNKRQQHKNIRKKEIKNNIDANASSSGAAAPDPDLSSQESVDFVGLMKFFNRTMEEAGAIIHRCKSCDGNRREFVRARIREHGLDAVYEMITKASKSDFLNGKSRSGWVADFTWLFRPSNFQKVLEGNYDNRTNNYNETNNHQSSVGGNPTNTVTGFVVHRAKN